MILLALLLLASPLRAEGHGFTRRRNLSDYYERTTAFFADKLGPAER